MFCMVFVDFIIDLFAVEYIDGLMQDCSNSIDNALELLQFCTKPLIYGSSVLGHPQING